MRGAILALYGLLLRVILPSAFRAEVGEELEVAVRSRLDSRRGTLAVLGLAFLELLDLLRTAGREWSAALSMWTQGLTQGVWLDLRVAIRSLVRARGFSTIVVVTLAIGIGANTAIFSVVDGVLLRPLPYPDADRIVRVAVGARPESGALEGPFSPNGYWHFQRNNRSFEAFGSGTVVQRPLTGEGPAVQIDVAFVTRSTFQVIGLQPQLGRLPSPEEDAPNGPLVALISDGLWSDRYGSDPSVLGRDIVLGEARFAVIGVMPPDYDFPARGTDAWVTRRLDPATDNSGSHFLEGIARLAPGVTIEDAVADAESLIARFGEVGYGPEWFEGIFTGRAIIRPLKEDIVGTARDPLLIVLGTVGLLLLVACANVANLLLVRAESRKRERALRAALGAGRGRLIRHVLMESVLLSLVGGLGGLLLAGVGTRVLVASGPAGIPRIENVGIHPSALALTMLVSLGVGLLFGLVPALRASRGTSQFPLRDGAYTAAARLGSGGPNSALVVGQVALALVLLSGSGLMIRSFDELRSVDPGFDAEDVLTFRLSPSPTKYPGAVWSAQFYDELVPRLEGLPGVTSAGGVTILPLTGSGTIRATRIDEFPTPEGEFPPALFFRRATPGYFATMGIPLVEGREFTQDDHDRRLGSLIISESVKRQFWPNESALGKRIQVGGGVAAGRVVGVIGDVHDASLESEPEQFVFMPLLDSIGGGGLALTIAVRVEADAESLPSRVRDVVADLDPDLPVTEVRWMEDLLADSMDRTSFTMTLLVLAALITLFLAAIGIYGVLSYLTARRTAEMGLRLALGADAGAVRALILSRGLSLASLGVALGVVGSIALGGVMESLLFGVSTVDPPTLAGASLLFLLVAAASSLIPALRAARTAPAEALRVGG